MDTERGGIEKPDGTIAPVMTISRGTVSTDTHTFSDIREVTELAAEELRKNTGISSGAATV